MKKNALNNTILSFMLAVALLLTGCGSRKKKVETVNVSPDIPQVSVDNNALVFKDEFGKDCYVNRSMAAGVMEEEKKLTEMETNNHETVPVVEEVKEENNIKYDFGYTIKDVYVWDNLEHKCFAGYANEYQKIMILSTDGEYSFIEYIDDNDQVVRGYIPVENYKKIPNTFIAIDKSRQELTMYIDNELVLTTNVVTGHYDKYDTPSGYFGITGKGTETHLIGKKSDGSIDYSEYVDYWMPFNGDIGIHDAEIHTHQDGFTHGWRDFNQVSKYTYTYNGSHGCVNVSNEDAKEIYENTSVGTKVLVHK